MTPEERAAELAKWIVVAKQLPQVGQTNGFWNTVPVNIAMADGRVSGAFFTYEGGDAADTDDDGVPRLRSPVPSFHTDEGLPYHNVTHWQPLPLHPKDLT